MLRGLGRPRGRKGPNAGGGGARELATDSEQAAPAQTAAMEAAWFLGNIAGLNDGRITRG